MNNDELKKKINEIISHTRIERLADALIAAGIGDVKTVQHISASATALAVLDAAKAEHRAEVAEKALRDALEMVIGEFGGGPLEEEVKSALGRAEKELAEERKDE